MDCIHTKCADKTKAGAKRITNTKSENNNFCNGLYLAGKIFVFLGVKQRLQCLGKLFEKDIHNTCTLARTHTHPHPHHTHTHTHTHMEETEIELLL